MYERFADYYDRWMQDVDTEQWALYLLRLYEKQGNTGKLTILDAACGTGNISIPLAQTGNQVIACDISEDMLSIAQEKARLKGVRIPFVRQNMNELTLNKSVDIVNSSCDGVNYLVNDGDISAFFESAYHVLKPNGWLSFDISSAYKIREVLDGRCYGEDEEDAAYLWQNAYDPETKRLDMYLTWFVEQNNGLFERFYETHVQRLYEIDEVTTLLEQAGYSNIQLYGDFTMKSPTATTQRIFFLAQKR